MADVENDDFALTFTFDENDFFTNEILKVSYHINVTIIMIRTIGWSRALKYRIYTNQLERGKRYNQEDYKEEEE